MVTLICFNIIELLTFKDCDGRNKLIDLKALYYINRKYTSQSVPKNLYLALSNGTCNLNLLYNHKIDSIEEAKSLSQFISLQKRLRHIILSEVYSTSNLFHNIVFNLLSTQSESLQILEFNNLSFNKISEEALNSLCLLCQRIKNMWSIIPTNFTLLTLINSFRAP